MELLERGVFYLYELPEAGASYLKAREFFFSRAPPIVHDFHGRFLS